MCIHNWQNGRAVTEAGTSGTEDLMLQVMDHPLHATHSALLT